MLNEKFNEYEDRNERFMSDMRNTKDKMEIMLKNPHKFRAYGQLHPYYTHQPTLLKARG